MAIIQKISSKDMRELLTNFQAEADSKLERMEDVQTLTDIIHEHVVNRAQSDEIASAIMRFVKKGKG